MRRTGSAVPRTLRILFVLERAGHLRKFEAGLRSLAARGHHLCLAIPASARAASLAVAERLAAEFEHVRIRHDVPTQSVREPYATLALACRSTVNYLRFLHPRHDAHVKIRHRTARKVPALARVMALGPLRRPAALRAAQRALGAIERVMPMHDDVIAFIRQERPDVLLVTPLVTFNHFLVDYVRTAAFLHVPSCLCVASWDNLTTKGILHAFPDKMIVWNDAQAREAWEELGYPPLRVMVTGAHAFDEWFHRQPRARDAYCARVGLDPAHPYVLYVCSSPFIADDETAFVSSWLDRLRGQPDARVRGLQVLIRPHPQNASIWSAWQSPHDGVVVSPRGGEDPVTESAKADYFDAMHHSRAVVGLNTTALIEAGIVGRPVLTMVTGTHGQETVPHFHHLADSGLLTTSHSFEDHFRSLARVIEDGAEVGGNESFVTSFVRPFGREWDAAPLFASAVEDVVDDGLAAGGGTMLRTRYVLPLALAANAARALRRRARRRA